MSRGRSHDHRQDTDDENEEEEIIQNNAGVDPIERSDGFSEGDEDADPYLVESGKILLDMTRFKVAKLRINVNKRS